MAVDQVKWDMLWTTRVERGGNKLGAVPSGVPLTLELVAVVVVVVVLV